MTTVSANNHFDEVVTSEVLTQAIKRGRLRTSAGVHATGVQYMPLLKSLLISFVDHSAVALPIQNYPELAALHEVELNALELGFAGSALCLESRDLQVSIVGLILVSQPLMEMAASLMAYRNGRKSSLTKAESARANGKKGGRRVVPAISKEKCLDKVPGSIRLELAALAAQPEQSIDFSDLPATSEQDWAGAVRGQFHRPVKQ